MKMWGITNTGLVRSENQDAYAAFTVGSYSAAVVCDGMGGTNGGRIASSIAVEQFEKELRAVLQENAGEEQLRQAMLYAISLANDAIRREAAKNADYQHMGTTLVCALAREDLVMVGNIGDSRAYYITAEDIRQISRDHSVVCSTIDVRSHIRYTVLTKEKQRQLQGVGTPYNLRRWYQHLHNGRIRTAWGYYTRLTLILQAESGLFVILMTPCSASACTVFLFSHFTERRKTHESRSYSVSRIPGMFSVPGS